MSFNVIFITRLFIRNTLDNDIDKLIDPKAKGEQAMLIKYLGSTEEKIEKLLDYPELFAAPIVRNGKKATVGFCPEVWKGWE